MGAVVVPNNPQRHAFPSPIRNPNPIKTFEETHRKNEEVVKNEEEDWLISTIF